MSGSLSPSRSKLVKPGVKNGEEGPRELMENLEHVHQFAHGISPKEGLSSLLSSCGCNKDYSSTEQSLMAQITVIPGHEICPACCSQRNEEHEVGAAGAQHCYPPTLHSTSSSLQGQGTVQGKKTLQPLAAYSSTRAQSQVSPKSETQESSW